MHTCIHAHRHIHTHAHRHIRTHAYTVLGLGLGRGCRWLRGITLIQFDLATICKMSDKPYQQCIRLTCNNILDNSHLHTSIYLYHAVIPVRRYHIIMHGWLHGSPSSCAPMVSQRRSWAVVKVRLRFCICWDQEQHTQWTVTQREISPTRRSPVRMRMRSLVYRVGGSACGMSVCLG